eukprot:gene16237-24884_t
MAKKKNAARRLLLAASMAFLLCFGEARSRVSLQLTCGLFSIEPLFRNATNLGAFALLADTGPVDMTCQRRYESQWLLDTCRDSRSLFSRISSHVDSMSSVCYAGSRKIKRRFYQCPGVLAPRLFPSPADWVVSARYEMEQALFCSFVADCSLDDFLASCQHGLRMLSRLIAECPAVLQHLSTACDGVHLTPNDLRRVNAQTLGLLPLTAPSPSVVLFSNAGGNASLPVHDVASALSAVERTHASLRPFLKLPAGFLAGTNPPLSTRNDTAVHIPRAVAL